MKFIPYAYQQYCTDKILAVKKLGLLLDMGLGWQDSYHADRCPDFEV